MKLFIVEDEVFALRTLCRKIEDLNEDWEISGTAADGVEALPLIEKTRPDVVLTDIRMSRMDGITLIREMKEKNIGAVPVIISGYQEFEYAKQAIQLGVTDYLLKPVEPEELRKCLSSCREKLKKSRTHQNIFSFLVGDETFSLRSVSPQDKILLCYLIFSTPLSNSGSLIHPVAGYISDDVIRSVFGTHLPKYPAYCFDGVFTNEKIVLLNLSAPPEHADGALDRITSDFAKYYHFPVTCYYQPAAPDNLAQSIQSARKACVNSAVLGMSRCGCTRPPAEAAENLTELIDLLILLIRQDDRELIHSNLLRLCMKWKGEKRTIVASQADLIFILKALNQKIRETADRRIDAVFYVENIYCFSDSFEELAANFSLLLTELFGAQTDPEEQSLKGEQLVERIEEYFRDNLSRSITLQILAEEMNISKVHLCRVFKKYRNLTPIDSFNRMKIDRARDLLTRFSGLPLQEISDMLGFSDVYYFSKVFKKIAGVSPSSYRKTHG